MPSTEHMKKNLIEATKTASAQETTMISTVDSGIASTKKGLQGLLNTLRFEFNTLEQDKKDALKIAQPGLEPQNLLGEEKAKCWKDGAKTSWLLNINDYKERAGEPLSRISAKITKMIDAAEMSQDNIY